MSVLLDDGLSRLNDRIAIRFRLRKETEHERPIPADGRANGFSRVFPRATASSLAPIDESWLQAFGCQGRIHVDDGDDLDATVVLSISRYTDQRTAPFAENAIRDATGAFVTNMPGKRIGNFVTLDGSYRLQLVEGLAATATVDNIFDKDPTFVRLNLSYDPFTADALGGTFKLGVRKSF